MSLDLIFILLSIQILGFITGALLLRALDAQWRKRVSRLGGVASTPAIPRPRTSSDRYSTVASAVRRVLQRLGKLARTIYRLIKQIVIAVASLTIVIFASSLINDASIETRIALFALSFVVGLALSPFLMIWIVSKLESEDEV